MLDVWADILSHILYQVQIKGRWLSFKKKFYNISNEFYNPSNKNFNSFVIIISKIFFFYSC